MSSAAVVELKQKEGARDLQSQLTNKLKDKMLTSVIPGHNFNDINYLYDVINNLAYFQPIKKNLTFYNQLEFFAWSFRPSDKINLLLVRFCNCITIWISPCSFRYSFTKKKKKKILFPVFTVHAEYQSIIF